MQQAAHERRRETRVARHLAIRYKRLEDLLHHDSWLEGGLVDLGGGGLSFLAAERFEPGSQLVIVLNFVGWREHDGEWTATGSIGDVGVLRAVGLVVWVASGHDEAGQWETGVRFAGTLDM
ncbi:MAG: PilZ domain-containing protein [Thermodesulfobacteriota bacterium]